MGNITNYDKDLEELLRICEEQNVLTELDVVLTKEDPIEEEYIWLDEKGDIIEMPPDKEKEWWFQYER